jgi:hypothetical protein
MDLRSFLALLLLAAAQHMTFGQFNCGQTELAGCESVTFTLLPGEEIVYTFGGDPLGDSWSSDLFVEIHDGTGAQCIYFAGYNDCNLTSECDFAGELGAQSGEPGSFEFNTVDLLSPLYPWTITVHNAYANSSAVSYELSTTCPTCGPLNCIEVCPGDDSNQLYLPVVPQASGTPAVWACATPSNYILADNQTCAADVVASDAYCTENSWDALCQDAYDACPGCTDPVACNFDPFALVDDGSCLEDLDGNGVCDVNEVYGCTDLFSLNFDPLATIDDGNCDYCSCLSCTEGQVDYISITLETGDDSYGIGLQVLTAAGDVLLEVPPFSFTEALQSYSFIVPFCMSNVYPDDVSSCFEIVVTSLNGNGLTSGQYSWNINDGTDTVIAGDSFTNSSSQFFCAYNECTVPGACNYNPILAAGAQGDNGWCNFPTTFEESFFSPAQLPDYPWSMEDPIPFEFTVAEDVHENVLLGYHPLGSLLFGSEEVWNPTDDFETCSVVNGAYSPSSSDQIYVDLGYYHVHWDFSGTICPAEVVGDWQLPDSPGLPLIYASETPTGYHVAERQDILEMFLNEPAFMEPLFSLGTNLIWSADAENTYNDLKDNTEPFSGVLQHFYVFGVTGDCFGQSKISVIGKIPEPVGGCTDALACNYDATATWDDGSCLVDLDDNGICDVEDVDGCTNPNDCNYNPDATSEGSFFMEVVGCNENQSFPYNYVMVSRGHFEQNFTRFVNRETILSVDGVDYLFHHHSLSNCDEILLYISPVSAPGGLSFGMNDQVLSPGDLIEVRNTPCQSLSFCTECDDAYVAQSVALSTTLLPDVPEVNVWTENYVYTSLKNSSTNVSYLLTGDEIAEFKQGGTTRYYELTTGGSEFENGIVYFDGDLGEDFEGGFLPGSFVRFFIPSEDCSGIGCTNPSACNFSSVHVIDDGSCLLDANANGVCDVDEVYGCMDDEACNYSPDATTEGTLSGTVIMNECDNQYQFNYFGIDADVYFQNQNLFIPGESMIEVSGQMYLLNSVSLAVGNECNPTNVLVFIGGNVSGLSFAEPLVGGEAWTLTNGPCASETYCGTCGNDYLDQSVARATSYLDEDEPPTWRGNYLLVDEPLLLNTEGSFAVELEQDGLVRFYYIYGYNTETGFIYLSDNNFCSELSAPLTSCSAFLLEDFEGGFRPGSIVRFIAPCCDDLNQNGTCDAEEGCTYSAADNYNALATVDDGSCQFASSNCPADIVPDGFVQLNDLLALLQQYGLLCSEP